MYFYWCLGIIWLTCCKSRPVSPRSPLTVGISGGKFLYMIFGLDPNLLDEPEVFYLEHVKVFSAA
jgi:hypothetical protein